MAEQENTTVIDGQRHALDLLRQLEAVNWNQNSPTKSRAAVKAALQATQGFPVKEADRFAAVLAEWITAPIVGLSLDLDEYEASIQRQTARADRRFRKFLAKVSQD